MGGVTKKIGETTQHFAGLANNPADRIGRGMLGKCLRPVAVLAREQASPFH
jgi:hypothetical protein